MHTSATGLAAAGWFSDSLPSAPIDKISFLRLDGDLYVSTMDPLLALYDKVSPGGLIYVDDYGRWGQRAGVMGRGAGAGATRRGRGASPSPGLPALTHAPVSPLRALWAGCSFNGCKKAIDEFRASRGIAGELTRQAAPDFGQSKFEAVWWIKQ